MIIHFPGEIETLEDGIEVIYCTVPGCGKELGRNDPSTGEHTAHAWVQDELVTEATCTSPAVYKFVCAYAGGCDATKEDKVGSSLGHDYSGVKMLSESNKVWHGIACIRCNETNGTENHWYPEGNTVLELPTSTSRLASIKVTKICVCGYAETTPYPVKDCTKTGVKPATCEDPEITYYTYTSKLGSINFSGITAPALGHDEKVTIENEVPSTCAVAGSYEEVTTCVVCEKELSRETKAIGKLPHTPGEAVVIENVIPAADVADGSHDEVVYCAECGAVLSSETVVDPALGIVAPVVPGDPAVEEIDAPSVPLAGLMTRAEFVNYLYVQAGSPEAALSTFVDVPADHEYALAIGWAQANGITLGAGNGRFAPDAIVTVEQAGLFLGRYAQSQGIEMPELSALADKASGEILDNADEVLTEFFG